MAQLTVTSSYPGGVLPALLVMGLGFGMIFAPAVNTATAGVPREDCGVASALANTMQQVGGPACSERFRTLWARQDVKHQAASTSLFNHPQVGPLALNYERLLIPGPARPRTRTRPGLERGR
jgi:hypothetical protein